MVCGMWLGVTLQGSIAYPLAGLAKVICKCSDRKCPMINTPPRVTITREARIRKSSIKATGRTWNFPLDVVVDLPKYIRNLFTFTYIYIQYIHETTHKSGLTMLPVLKSMKNMTSVVSKVEMLGGYEENSWRDHGDDSLWFVSTRLLYSQLLMSVLQAFFKIISYKGKDSVAKIGTHCIPTFADRCMNIWVNYNNLRKPQKI